MCRQRLCCRPALSAQPVETFAPWPRPVAAGLPARGPTPSWLSPMAPGGVSTSASRRSAQDRVSRHLYQSRRRLSFPRGIASACLAARARETFRTDGLRWRPTPQVDKGHLRLLSMVRLRRPLTLVASTRLDPRHYSPRSPPYLTRGPRGFRLGPCSRSLSCSPAGSSPTFPLSAPVCVSVPVSLSPSLPPSCFLYLCICLSLRPAVQAVN